MRYNRNRRTDLDPKYVAQQSYLRTLCDELDLEVYYPDYHAAKDDCNTVLIYTKVGAANNRLVDEETRTRGYSVHQYSQPVCSISNTDINGRFSLDFMNRGRLDLRTPNWKEKLKDFLVCRALGHVPDEAIT